MENSKAISATDESAKRLIIDALNGENTGGFDLDSVYYIDGQYIVLEFLKCDSSYPSVTPYTSHPNRYWFNKQKFISLWDLTRKLDGRLFLLNYEEPYNRFRCMEVTSLDPQKGIENTDAMWNYDQFKKWFVELNHHHFIEIKDV